MLLSFRQSSECTSRFVYSDRAHRIYTVERNQLSEWETCIHIIIILRHRRRNSPGETSAAAGYDLIRLYNNIINGIFRSSKNVFYTPYYYFTKTSRESRDPFRFSLILRNI